MNQLNLFSISSSIILNFNNSNLRDIYYSSFLPEFNELKTKRSKLYIEKKNNKSLIFKIESNDINAFRASINEIISFGKAFTDSLKIFQNS
jgi:tRNA threonylcarbamoyladenosine modification (KEOPS) complex  Pcc1 subunit